MAKITAQDLQALGLDEDTQSAILDKQSAKAAPRTHLKHWVYMTEEQALIKGSCHSHMPFMGL